MNIDPAPLNENDLICSSCGYNCGCEKTTYKLLDKEAELKKLKEKALTNQHIQAIFGLQELHKCSDEELFLYMTLKFIELSDGYLKTLNDQLRKKK